MGKGPAELHVNGTVKWFDENRGVGIIRTDSGRDVSVHYSDIEGDGYRTLSEGERVEFDVVQSSKGPRAADVRRVASEE